MASKKLGSVKATDTVIITSTNLATEVTGTLGVANGGTGQTTYTDGQLLIGNTTGNTLNKNTLTGTANQVVVTNGSGTITLSLPQSIGTGSSPTFTNLTLNGTLTVTGKSTFNNATVNTPVSLTDAATIATDASLGNRFRVTLGGNRTLGAPTNPTDGQQIAYELIQDATGSRTLSLDTGTGGFVFGSDITSITLTTTASKRDFLTAIYNSTANKWYVVGFIKGF